MCLKRDIDRYDQAAGVVRRQRKRLLAAVQLLQTFTRVFQSFYQAIVSPEATAYHLPWMRTRIDDYGPNCRGRLEQGLAIPATAYVQAQQERRLLVRDAAAVLEEADLLLAPGAVRTPPRLDEEGAAAPRGSTNVFNITGLPVLSVPCGFSDTNLPISVQLIGRP